MVTFILISLLLAVVLLALRNRVFTRAIQTMSDADYERVTQRIDTATLDKLRKECGSDVKTS